MSEPIIGRKAKSEQTKQNILAAAEKAFSDLGLYGARIDDIAAAAGINKRMLYEYFGNKEALYRTVLERVYLRINVCEEEFISCADTSDAADAIRRLVRIYFTFLAENPTYVRMIMWENLNGGRYFDEQGLSDSRNPILSAMHSILERGQSQGVFRKNADEKQLLMTLFACSFNYFSNRHTMQRIMDTEFLSEAETSKRIAFITDMLLTYLKTTSQEDCT